MVLSSPQADAARRQLHTRWLLCLGAAALLLWGRIVWTKAAHPPVRPPAALSASVPSLYALETVCTHDPNSAEAFAALGERLEQLGASRLADGAFARAASLAPFVQTGPAAADAHLALAQWYQKSRLRRRAYDEAAAAAQLQSDRPAAYREMATAALALERYPDAEAALKRVIALDPNDWHSVRDLGFVEENLQRPAEAVNDYQQAALLVPGEAEPLRMYGQALLQQSDAAPSIGEAERSLEQAARMDPTDVLTHVLLAQIASRRGDWSEARVQIALADKLPAANSDVQSLQTYQAAQIYQRFGQSRQAQAAQKRHAALLAYQTKKFLLFHFIVAHPADIAARLALARTCTAHADFTEAVSAYRRLLTLAPSRAAQQEMDKILQRHPQPVLASTTPAPMPLALRIQDAATLAADRQYDAASQVYLQALSTDQNSAEALLGLGKCLQHQGRAEMAFTFLDQAFQHGAQEAPTQFAVAAQFESNGFHDAARIRLEQLTAQAPANADAWRLLGSVCRQSPRYTQESRAAYRRASALRPQNTNILLELADADAEAGQSSLAESEYRRATALSPAEADGLSRFAGFLLDRPSGGQTKEAEQLLSKALTLQPQNEFAWYQRGRLSLGQNRITSAVSALRRSVSLAPDVAQSWYALALALRRAGDTARASQALTQSQRLQQAYLMRSQLEEQIHLHPADSQMRLRLARIYAAQGETSRAILEYQDCLRQNSSLTPVRQELGAYEKQLRAQNKFPLLLVFRYMLAHQPA